MFWGMGERRGEEGTKTVSFPTQMWLAFATVRALAHKKLGGRRHDARELEKLCAIGWLRTHRVGELIVSQKGRDHQLRLLLQLRQQGVWSSVCPALRNSISSLES